VRSTNRNVLVLKYKYHSYCSGWCTLSLMTWDRYLKYGQRLHWVIWDVWIVYSSIYDICLSTESCNTIAIDNFLICSSSIKRRHTLTYGFGQTLSSYLVLKSNSFIFICLMIILSYWSLICHKI